MATNLPHLPDVQRLSPHVFRILGGNPGKFTLQGSNTYLLGTGSSRLLIDTGEGRPQWRSSLSSLLASESATISTCLLTHWHPDHVGGIPDLLSLCPDCEVYKAEPELGNPNLASPDAKPWRDIAHGQTFQVEGVSSLRAFHCPGHTVDHMALVLESEDAMFTGDNVLGHGTAVFEDLAAYMESLERMRHEFAGRAYPGHGDVIEDGKAKVREYIAHRKEREGQILQAMGSEGDKKRDWKSMEIVKIVYKEYPESLHEPAEKGVVQVLDKLEGEGKVVKDENADSWRLSNKASL
ncbi:metallo-beta-lactamase domain-containing protein [Viridothelium virens]|uniref:Metallo-beta-lactamase domain-containing protein n=1 Tax=Viridothelium virens TaxID=1048519 RepID=A0A6A6HHD7_VIRVR|nr:metallo-beta-lactamase domain-containing protein [Viridothelium virens]